LAPSSNRHARKITMADLPRIGTPMFLVHNGHELPLPARSGRGRHDQRDRAAGDRGCRCSAAWPADRGFWAQPRARVIRPCRLVRIAAAAPYQWILEPIGEPRKSNRREFVRGGGPAVGLGTDEDVRRLNGKLLDISEGGLRCWVPEAGGVKVGDRMSASLRLSTGSLEQDGAVHTVRPAYDEAGHQLILTFHSDEATAQLIRQHVFAWELAERSRNTDC
jgi:hypothetical protein